MSYTLIEITPVSSPMVVIYRHGVTNPQYEAMPVVAIGLYRDLDYKGSDNYAKPLTASELVMGQRHHYESPRTFEASLPIHVEVSQDLLDDVLELSPEQGGAVEVELSNGVWTVVK